MSTRGRSTAGGERDYCRRLKTDCVPGRPGCVLTNCVFAVPVEERIRLREEENRQRALQAALAPSAHSKGAQA